MSKVDVNSSCELPRFTGSVTIQLVNTETKEVEYEHTEPNIVTFVPYYYLNGSSSGMTSPRIWISDRNLTKTASFQKAASNMITTLEISSLTPSIFSLVVPKTISSPYMAEFRAQFQPPTTTRTIYSLGLTGSAGGYVPSTMVALTYPCTQTGSVPGPGQTLVVTYRVQILPAVASPGALPVARSADRFYAEMFAAVNYTTDGLNSIREGGISGWEKTEYVWNPNIPDNMGINVLQASRYYFHNGSLSGGTSTINGVVTTSIPTSSGSDTSNVLSYVRYGSNVNTTVNTNTWNIGAICGSAFFGSSAISWNATYGLIGLYMGPVAPSTWDPVQNIFNHGVGGTEPFQQIAELASGSGIVNATAVGTWTNPTWPEYYRLSINVTGDTGVATYSFSQRTMSGFTTNPAGTGTGSSWTTSAAPVTIMPSMSYAVSTIRQGVHGEDMNPTGSYHYKRVHPSIYEDSLGKITKRNATSVMTWDFNGITVYDIKDNWYAPFDSTTTPALPVSYIHQVSVDSQGNIWVACTATGLWKISADLTTCTNITTFDTVTTTNVRAVDVGVGDRIFVLVEGGLFSSVNYGSTWVQESFTYTGITDGNWNRVYWIRLQPNSPTFRMYIQTSWDGSTFDTVWWSTASGSAIQGPSWGSTHFYTTNMAYHVGIHHTRMLTVSRSGEFWTLTTQLGAYQLFWGKTTTLIMHSSANSSNFAGTAFADDCVYDYYGTPYATGGSDQTGTASQSAGIPLFDTSITMRGRWSRINNVSYQLPFVELSDGMHLIRGVSNLAQSYAIWSPCPNFAAQEGAITTRLPKNIEHSHFEEMVWNNYGWNGSAWVKGYHAPALDTSGSAGGPFTGTRHRFNTESHGFTGRSCIEVPPTAISSFFTTELTFAARITPLARLGSQGIHQQLFSWINLNNDTSVRLYVNDGTNNVSLWVGENRTYIGYTTTNNPIGLGSKTFTTTASGLPYTAGMRLRLSVRQTNDWMEGTVTSYTGTTLVMNIDSTSGSTTSYNRWTINYAGVRFGSTPTYGNTSNIALIISGTSASFYVDGVQLGTTQTILSTDFSVANAEFVIGGNRVNAVDGIGFDIASSFYRGTMLNVLLDSAAWSGGNISSHQAAPTTYTTATTRVRYQLSNSLVGLEAKPTHAGNEEVLNGVHARFTDGGGGDSFVSDEYYTFGVCKGVLKDNATSFTHQFNSYYLPVEHGFTDTDTPTIPSVTTPVTEKVCFRWLSTSSSLYAHPGYFLVGNPSSYLDHGFQTITGDFTYTGIISNDRISTDTDAYYFLFGLTDTITTGTSTMPRWAIRIKGGAAKTIDVLHSGAVVASNVATWSKGDTVTIQRTGSVIVFRLNAATIYTTSGGQNYANTVNPSGYASPTNEYRIWVHGHTITYDRPAYVVGIGNQANLTGKYDPSFHNVGGYMASRGAMTVNIAGYANPATITVAGIDKYYSELVLSPPAANNVILVPDAGYIICSPVDAGKAISVDCTVIKYNFT